VRLLLRDRFPVADQLSGSEVPVTVVYGDRDSVVPTELSERLADEVPVLAERMVVEDADHNDAVMFGPQVADAVARLADKVAS
jgi:pimeloyl-ACP methyl ester carboxylesterase